MATDLMHLVFFRPMPLIPSVRELLEEALANFGADKDLNSIHAETYRLMLHYRNQYYKDKIENFLNMPGLKLDAPTAS